MERQSRHYASAYDRLPHAPQWYPATERPAPISPVSESVTASGADAVFTHAASAVYRHHNAADRTPTAAFGCLTHANAPLFPPRQHNSPAERARFLPLRMRRLL